MTDLDIRNIINNIRKKKYIQDSEDTGDSYTSDYDYNDKQIKKAKRIILIVVIAALIIVICIFAKMLKNIAKQQNMQRNILDVKQICQRPKNIIIMSSCQNNQEAEERQDNEQTQQITEEEQRSQDVQNESKINEIKEEQIKQQNDIKNKDETNEQQEIKEEQKDSSAEISAEINKEDLIKLMNLKQNINEMNTITNNNIKTLQKITQKYNDIDNSIKDIKELYEKIEIIKEPRQIEERKQTEEQEDNKKEISQEEQEDKEKLI